MKRLFSTFYVLDVFILVLFVSETLSLPPASLSNSASTTRTSLPVPSPVTFSPTFFNGSCPEGTHDCGFFKCVTEPGCPLDCHFYDKEQSCSSVRLNGVGCIWQKRRCFRDIKCSLLPESGCSPGCFNCGRYKCLPDGGLCPKGCDAYFTQMECQTAMAFNGIGCQWTGEICDYYELENRMDMPNREDAVFMLPGFNSTVVGEPVPVEPMEYTKMKSASKWGPIIGITVGAIAAVGMVFVLVHKKIESKKEFERQVKLIHGVDINDQLPKTAYRPHSFAKAVRNVLGLHKQEASISTVALTD